MDKSLDYDNLIYKLRIAIDNYLPIENIRQFDELLRRFQEVENKLYNEIDNLHDVIKDLT